MYASVTDVKARFSHYLSLSQQEDVLIRKRGKVVAVLSRPGAGGTPVTDSIAGICNGMDAGHDYRAERVLGR
jgi:ATP-dependent Lon protease